MAFKDLTLCVYCGDIAVHQDHIIPRIARLGWGKGTVPACAQCNCTLSGNMVFGVRERARFLYKRYTQRKANGEWFQVTHDRLDWLRKVCLFEIDDLSPETDIMAGMRRPKPGRPNTYGLTEKQLSGVPRGFQTDVLNGARPNTAQLDFRDLALAWERRSRQHRPDSAPTNRAGSRAPRTSRRPAAACTAQLELPGLA